MAELPTPLLQEMVAAAQPQPESEVPNGPDISHGTTVNAAPQGSEPPAGAAELCPTCGKGHGGNDYCSDAFHQFDFAPGAATPPPQPPGGTPEVAQMGRTAQILAGLHEQNEPAEFEGRKGFWVQSDALFIEDASCPQAAIVKYRETLAACSHNHFCGSIIAGKRQAALAAALAEVEAARVVVESMNTELKAGMAAMVQFDKERATLRAELEQTRRDVEVKRAGLTALAADYDKLAARLTAAEERADGAERHDEQMNVALGKLAPKGTWLCEVLENIWRAPSQDEAVKIAEAAAPEVKAGGLWSGPRVRENLEEAERQRDTALRERDEARKDTARLDILESAGDCTIEKDTRSIATSLLLNKEEYVAGCLRHCLDAALAAKTPEGGV